MVVMGYKEYIDVLLVGLGKRNVSSLTDIVLCCGTFVLKRVYLEYNATSSDLNKSTLNNALASTLQNKTSI
jgi:hypothetical protein